MNQDASDSVRDCMVCFLYLDERKRLQGKKRSRLQRMGEPGPLKAEVRDKLRLACVETFFVGRRQPSGHNVVAAACAGELPPARLKTNKVLTSRLLWRRCHCGHQTDCQMRLTTQERPAT